MGSLSCHITPLVIMFFRVDTQTHTYTDINRDTHTYTHRDTDMHTDRKIYRIAQNFDGGKV